MLFNENSDTPNITSSIEVQVLRLSKKLIEGLKIIGGTRGYGECYMLGGVVDT